MFGRRSPKTVKKMTLKSLKKAFPNLIPSYVEHLYTLFYWSAFGLLSTATDPPLYEKMMEAFQEFLEKCEKITSDALEAKKKEDEELLKKYPKADVRYWVDGTHQN